MEYLKPPLNFDEQLQLLISRGLKISNLPFAHDILRNISYYRLSAYFVSYKVGENFKENTTFEDIVNLYIFDRKLRMLVLDAIEPIEISLRARIIYYLSHRYGVFGYLNPQNFSERFRHAQWVENLEQAILDSPEAFIKHYRNKYTLEKNLPLWMALEVISFGGLSRLFRGLKGEDQQAIAKSYGVTDVVLSSWLQTIVYARNTCAHHARFWNRTLTLKFLLPKKQALWEGIRNDRLFGLLTIVHYLLTQIDIKNSWKNQVIQVVNQYPQIPLATMGFPIAGFSHPLWQ